VSETPLGLFGRVEEFPNSDAARRLAGIVGLNDIIGRLVADATALLDPSLVEKWSVEHHGAVVGAVAALTSRTPLFVFAGDVGVGKTELAEVLGQAIAKHTDASVTLYPLSLTARGKGAVGEMTTLLTQAFERVRGDFAKARSPRTGRAASMGILLVDEADAIAQSREEAQMHHEDRAGVNALIRGIDDLRADHFPVLTILCTNRLDALDPAVRRRAAVVQEFLRPDTEQRHELLVRLLGDTDLTQADIDSLTAATGPVKGREHGFTYSDIRQRLVPELVLAAYRADVPIDKSLLADVLPRVPATRPFAAAPS